MVVIVGWHLIGGGSRALICCLIAHRFSHLHLGDGLLETRRDRGGPGDWVRASGEPLTLEVELAGRLALVDDGEPGIEAARDAH